MSWRNLRWSVVAVFTAAVFVYSGLFLACIDCRDATPVAKIVNVPLMAEELPLPRYVGCQAFSDPSLAFKTAKSGNMTVDICISICYQRDFDFALLQGGNCCYCSSVGGTGGVQTEDRCSVRCSGNANQFCGGPASVAVYALRVRDGIQEWTTWMTMEDSNLHRRYRGCKLDGNASCSVVTETKITGKLDDWEKDLKKNYIGCFTTKGIVSAALRRSKPVNDWPLNARECVSHCWWFQTPFAAVVTLGSERECVCTPTLGSSRPINTCIDMYGAQVFVLTSYMQPDILRFSVEVRQQKVLLIGYLQTHLPHVLTTFVNQPNTFYMNDLNLLLSPNDVSRSQDDSYRFGSALNCMEATVPVHEVLHPYYHCNAYRMSSMFMHWKDTAAINNAGFSNYVECTKMVYGDFGFAKCLPFLEEACKTSTLVVGATSALLNQRNLEWFIWHNPDVHVIHVIRDPVEVLSSAKRAFRNEHSTTALTQRMCSQILATNDHFQKQAWTRHLHTLFYEETASSATKVIAFVTRNLGLNLTAPSNDTITQDPAMTDPTGQDSAAVKLSNSSSSTADLSKTVKELCPTFYKTFPKRYKAPIELPGRAGAQRQKPAHVKRQISRASNSTNAASAQG